MRSSRCDHIPAASNNTGRPRDPTVELRVLEAAREELAERGVGGFSLRQVTKRSGVTRPSIILRWPDVESLIIDAVDGIAGLPPLTDTGTLRGDLEALVEDLDLLLRPPIFNLQYKLAAEATKHPSLYLRYQEKVMRPAGSRVKSILLRAIERGEIPESIDIPWFVHALIGGLVVRTVSSRGLVPPNARERQGLIDLLLAGVGYVDAVPRSSVARRCTAITPG